MTEQLKTYEVQLEGRVNFTCRVKAKSKRDAISEAYSDVDTINKNSEIYVDWYYDTDEDEVEEIDLLQEKLQRQAFRYHMNKRKELGEEEYRKNVSKINQEVKELFGFGGTKWVAFMK